MWTENMEQALRNLWAAGVGANDIAERLGNGVTKNAVIGKARRLKLGHHVVFKRAKLKPYVRRKLSGPRKSPARKKIYSHENPVPFDKVEHGCMYPVKDKLFCAQVRNGDSPYCEAHHAVCYRPSIYQR